MRPSGFAADGTDYEIDVSTKNAAAFRKLLAPYIDMPAGRPGPGSPGRADRGQPAALG